MSRKSGSSLFLFIVVDVVIGGMATAAATAGAPNTAHAPGGVSTAAATAVRPAAAADASLLRL